MASVLHFFTHQISRVSPDSDRLAPSRGTKKLLATISRNGHKMYSFDLQYL